MIDPIRILWTQLQAMAADFIRLLPQLMIAGLLLAMTWLAARFARRIADWLLAKADLRGSLVNLGETLITVLIWVIGILTAASIVLPGVTPESILAVLGLGSVAVGFAFKDIFENFLAGILIMVRKKMEIGDFIECGDVKGKVEHITLRDTHLRFLSNELVLVPNAYLFTNPMIVVTDPSERRYEIAVGVAYDVDMDAAAAVIEAATKGLEGLSPTRQVDVFATGFGESSMDFMVRWWADSRPLEGHRTRDRVVRAIKRALDEAGMEIPFPYRTLTFKEPLPLTRAAPKADSPPD